MSVISNTSESATSTSTEGFQIDSFVNQTLENSTDFSLEKGNSTVSDDNEVFFVKKVKHIKDNSIDIQSSNQPTFELFFAFIL